MKKKKHLPEPIQLVSRKKRDFFRALSKNPNILKEAMEITKTTEKIIEAKDKVNNLPALTLDDWVQKAFAILPVNFSSEINLELIKNFATTLKENET